MVHGCKAVIRYTPFTSHLVLACTPVQSYSPYTHCPSGVALVLHDGQVVAGSYVENAAHNPGLAPFQAAIVAAVRAGIADYTKVREPVCSSVAGGGGWACACECTQDTSMGWSMGSRISSFGCSTW